MTGGGGKEIRKAGTGAYRHAKLPRWHHASYLGPKGRSAYCCRSRSLFCLVIFMHAFVTAAAYLDRLLVCTSTAYQVDCSITHLDLLFSLYRSTPLQACRTQGNATKAAPMEKKVLPVSGNVIIFRYYQEYTNVAKNSGQRVPGARPITSRIEFTRE